MYADEHDGWYPLSDYRVATLLNVFTLPAAGSTAIDGRLLFNRYGINLKTLSCPSGSWQAQFYLNSGLLSVNYYYNAGVSNWTGPNHWYGYHYESGGRYKGSTSVTDLPVPRRKMIKVQDETALMTDVYVPQNNPDLLGDPSQWFRVWALYSGSTPATVHQYFPGSHLKRGQVYSAGLNVLTVDGSVRWMDHAPHPAAAPKRPRLRHQHFWSNMYW